MEHTQTATISAQLAALPSLPMADLWALWDQHFPRRPEHRNRNYVESRLAYRIQEKAYGALLFTGDGERLVPSYTNKKGKTYRYYSPVKHRRFGAWASEHGPLPAAPIEALVIEQIQAALSAPHIVQAVCDRMQQLRPDISEPEVVLPMRNLARLWPQLFPVEQCRLAQLLMERVIIANGGLEIIWRDNGWQELAAELMPGTIGAELQEWEQMEETV